MRVFTKYSHSLISGLFTKATSDHRHILYNCSRDGERHRLYNSASDKLLPGLMPVGRDFAIVIELPPGQTVTFYSIKLGDIFVDLICASVRASLVCDVV